MSFYLPDGSEEVARVRDTTQPYGTHRRQLPLLQHAFNIVYARLQVAQVGVQLERGRMALLQPRERRRIIHEQLEVIVERRCHLGLAIKRR